MTEAHPAKVMVVEDEWLVAAVIVAALEDAAYEILGPVGRVEEALRLLAHERPDAALLDINLSGKRSFEIADELRARAIPFAFMSGYAPTDLPPAYCGAPLVQKPVDPATLNLCVRALLRPH